MRSISSLVVSTVALAFSLVAGCMIRAPREPSAPRDAPPCRPVDSAWAVRLEIIDAVTDRPISDAGAWSWNSMEGGVTDSTGWACFRSLAEGTETLHVARLGYEERYVEVSGRTGATVQRRLRLRRVASPCCDLRGEWRVEFVLDSPARFHPNPKARVTAGTVRLGTNILPPEDGDLLDSVVHVVRGLHAIDFTPFFDGPVASDVSTSVFGSGPDLLREVMALVPSGDSVSITFIPRMSHGSLSLQGRLIGDTARGNWVQNAYCCGAFGTFTMARIGPPDTTSWPIHERRRDSRRRSFDPPPRTVHAGRAPGGRWRPELVAAPNGRLWVAIGGLYVADSLLGEWTRVLGGPEDAIQADELRIGVRLAFVGHEVVLLGIDSRYPATGGPTLYRSADGGVSWRAVPATGANDVEALVAHERSVWLATWDHDLDATVLHRSDDGGKAWERVLLPARIANVTELHRVDADEAYLATMVDDTLPALWRTVDGGATWAVVPTPHDQGLQRLEPYESRIEEIATVGHLVVVREHAKVFVSDRDSTGWRPLPKVRHVASAPGDPHILVLLDSLRPALLDASLRELWRGERALPVQVARDIEQLRWTGHAGYASTSSGTIFEVRDGRIRELRAADETPGDTVQMMLRPPGR